MKTVLSWVAGLRIWKDRRGQDLIEYALMAGFVAVAAGSALSQTLKAKNKFAAHCGCDDGPYHSTVAVFGK